MAGGLVPFHGGGRGFGILAWAAVQGPDPSFSRVDQPADGQKAAGLQPGPMLGTLTDATSPRGERSRPSDRLSVGRRYGMPIRNSPFGAGKIVHGSVRPNKPTAASR